MPFLRTVMEDNAHIQDLASSSEVVFYVWDKSHLCQIANYYINTFWFVEALFCHCMGAWLLYASGLLVFASILLCLICCIFFCRC